ncbi:hypothetical protein GCM10025861_19240 [Methanobacterium petrolearium]|nr:hypothetical protein GCM10025861_19240 [Methanobacterium petrolearium]
MVIINISLVIKLINIKFNDYQEQIVKPGYYLKSRIVINPEFAPIFDKLKLKIKL